MFETVTGSIAMGCLIALKRDRETKAFSASSIFSLLLNTYNPNEITETFFSLFIAN